MSTDNNSSEDTLMKYCNTTEELSVALVLANRIVQHAKNHMYPIELCCPDCDFYPIEPVTGRCGHTRCLHCIELNGNCPCGAEAPEKCNINIMVQALLKKMLASYDSDQPQNSDSDDASTSANKHCFKMLRNKHKTKEPLHVKICRGQRFPVTLKMRYDWTLELIDAKKYKEAVPHLAILAAEIPTKAAEFKRLLAHVIKFISGDNDPRHLMLDLYKSVRLECAIGAVKESDMECGVCFNPVRLPVTTHCGHTFCRTCLRRTILYTKRCAMCRSDLNIRIFKRTAETKFIKVALNLTGRIDSFTNYFPEYIPIYSCTMGYPTIACHLLIYKTRNSCRIMKWIMEFGARKFGLVYGTPHKNTVGTMVEIKDCVQLENGNCICTAIGVSRFRVLELVKIDGCNMAEVMDYEDLIPRSRLQILVLKHLARTINRYLSVWITSLDTEKLNNIIVSHGCMPRMEDGWWNAPHGPNWLWWIIAILPVTDNNFRQTMLSMNNLADRLIKVCQLLKYFSTPRAIGYSS